MGGCSIYVRARPCPRLTKHVMVAGDEQTRPNLMNDMSEGYAGGYEAGKEVEQPASRLTLPLCADFDRVAPRLRKLLLAY